MGETCATCRHFVKKQTKNPRGKQGRCIHPYVFIKEPSTGIEHQILMNADMRCFAEPSLWEPGEHKPNDGATHG
jgi:hypothetical protein